MHPVRILRFLTLLAVLIMPVGMANGASAMALPPALEAAPASGHCAGMQHERKKAPQPARSHDCTLACAAIAPELGGIEAAALGHASPEPVPLSRGALGLHPEAATPPPRLA